MEVLGRAARAAPAQELGQVQELVLEDPLQGLEPVVAEQAADDDLALDILERAEQERGRDRDLVIDALGHRPGHRHPADLAHRLARRPGEPPREPERHRMRPVLQQHLAQEARGRTPGRRGRTSARGRRCR